MTGWYDVRIWKNREAVDGSFKQYRLSLLVGGLEHDFYDFPYIGNNDPNWLIFFRGVEATNQNQPDYDENSNNNDKHGDNQNSCIHTGLAGSRYCGHLGHVGTVKKYPLPE